MYHLKRYWRAERIASRAWYSRIDVGRAKALAALREHWGAPRSRERNLNTIAEYHRARAVPGASLDDRTWTDLDLDAVFSRLDHTTSTIGQQALYDRLRTAPVARHLGGFSALADRIAADTSSRERAQLALARLQHPAGYDLWWLAQPGAIESQRWHVLFPILAIAVAAALLLMFYWPGAIIVVAAAAVTNLVVRAATATRVAAVLGAFRQIRAAAGRRRRARLSVGCHGSDHGPTAERPAAARPAPLGGALGQPRSDGGRRASRLSVRVSESAVPARCQRALFRSARARGPGSRPASGAGGRGRGRRGDVDGIGPGGRRRGRVDAPGIG